MNWTTTPPTKPGFYAWRLDEKSPSQVIILIPDNELESPCRARLSRYEPFDIYGEWCRLVPAEEIEKAFREGWQMCNMANNPGSLSDYESSLAKHIAEGTI